MSKFKKNITLFLILSVINFYLPTYLYAQETTKKTENDIIEYEPESSISTAKKLPATGGGVKWLWALLGVAVIGGVVAAAGGGGSDDGGGSNDNDDDSTATGGIGGSW